jgi:hypothetical protein
MRKGTLVFIVGIIFVLLPYLGIPSEWKVWCTVLLGAVLILVGYAIRRENYLQTIDQGNGTRADETFVETTQHLFE